ncbi:putative vanillate O-demethylase oxidoreductase [Glonium stellatum]|uniref:Putative vanillate O-demethylase oxidoreductase n=1 Tax=Glonium stellatum TaxID=574774 RepID=A0A8E2F3U1_9PEZI|nr:putative vanillate O-demethylase oxidoreductase [Glonium stellatum]
MAIYDVSALQEPFQSEKLVQVRTGKIKTVFGLPVLSAIFKTPRKDPVKVSKLGCEDDEHAFESHGGPDQALLHYCSRHYDAWRTELPSSAHLFSVGGFGENIVSSCANEHNICIGDIIAIGDEVVVQVSHPRQPCFKLNHRFEVKDMSRRSQTLARTGWYYRVLKEGCIQPGDEIKLLQRINPKWTVSTVQRYLYSEINNIEAMKELVELESLGSQIRNIFRNRLNKEFEDQERRLVGDETTEMKVWSEYKIVQKNMETPRISSFILEAVEPAETPTKVEPGSHVRLKLSGKLVRAYSVISGSTNSFELGVALDVQSRGGSEFLHEKAKPGDILTVGQITASFPLAKEADHHIIIAGGIGITAFLAATQYLKESGQSYEFHFAVATDVPFYRYLQPLGNKVTIYNKSKGQALNISKVLARNNDNSHVYCCGPPRLMDGVAKAAEQCGLPKDHVHFETFQVATSGDPFTAELLTSKKTIEVESNQSLLDVLRAVGLDIDSSCEVGNCGTCRVGVNRGRIDHRGTALLAEERETAMLSCVSRGIGHIALDL